MSDARGSPCTHKSSVHWQQNESKGWFSGECGFQGHFICKHNFFYWALSDAILDISINCCDWGCWVTGDSVPWLPDSNPASSIVILPRTGRKKSCGKSHKEHPFWLELISWPRASSWSRNWPSTITPVARRKALGAGRKGCWGFLVGSRTFARKKMQKLVIAKPPRHLVFFLCNSFSAPKIPAKLLAKWS